MLTYKEAINHPGFETFVVYFHGNGRYTICARMKERRVNENYKEDNLPKCAPIVFRIKDFKDEFMRLSVDERNKIPVTYEVPRSDLLYKYSETFKMLEEYDRGILPDNYKEDFEFFEENFTNGNWGALKERYLNK